MCPSRCLLFLATLLLLIHLSLARATPVSRPAKCLDHSQNLLKTTNQMLENAIRILKHYPCSAEDIDHEDITADQTSTLQACLPLELAKDRFIILMPAYSFLQRGSCLPPQNTSLMMTLCLSSIYEDLKMYREEFKAINKKLLDHNQKQIILDKDMLTAIDELMQTPSLEGADQTPSPEGADQYRVKMKLCILLHAFHIRAMTINRVMSYLNSS
ncbi:Interleukin-12 subunit alpha [Lemmus lemmus]